MYGLPQDFDVSVFCRCTLELVSFTENTIHFAFDREVSLTLQSSYRFKSSDGTEESGTVPVTQSRLMVLTGQLVQTAVKPDNSTLRLIFEGGSVLEFFDDMPIYESFQIRIGSRDIIV